MGQNFSKLRDVFIVDGNRSPFLKARGQRGLFSASDLAVNTGRVLLARQPFAPTDIGEVVIGCVNPSENEANIARIIALRLGCGDSVPGYTVQRNCASGMQALDCAAKDIAFGRHDLVLAGGAEAMSHAPLILRPEMVNWLAEWASDKNFIAKMKTLTKLRPYFLKPIISLLCGLTDPIVNLNMGHTAENLAYQFNIARAQMDEFSLRSHQRVAAAQDHNYLQEVEPIYGSDGRAFVSDDGVRRDTSLEKLGQLKPTFDKTFGQVTAGNSSQVTDGAALLILASQEAVDRYQLPVLGRIVDVTWAALSPAVMGLGPVYATAKLLQQTNLNFSDIDYWEINEAFAVQVLACLKAFADPEFCRGQLNLDKPLGNISEDRLNVDGGAIALGHPVGASGARIVLHLLKILERNNAQRGVATICIGGGQGGAMLVERVGSRDKKKIL